MMRRSAATPLFVPSLLLALAIGACGGHHKGPQGPPPEYEEPQPPVPSAGVAPPPAAPIHAPADAGPG